MKSILKLFAVGVFLVLPALGAQAADRIGKIKIASGEVSITRDGVEIAAESGAELFELDVVTTGTNSAVDDLRRQLAGQPGAGLVTRT